VLTEVQEKTSGPEVFHSIGWFSLVPTGVLLGVTGLPFQICQLKNFIDAIPSELEEAAFMERASSFQILRLSYSHLPSLATHRQPFSAS
jgi:ABC-type maltose transport system permease subunit